MKTIITIIILFALAMAVFAWVKKDHENSGTHGNGGAHSGDAVTGDPKEPAPDDKDNDEGTIDQ